MSDLGGDGRPAITHRRRRLNRADNRLVRGVGRVPTTVQRKLLVAFTAIAGLLVVLGVLGLRGLSESNDRVEALGRLQERAASYKDLQNDAAQIRALLALRPTGEINAYLGDTSAPPPNGASLAISDAAITSILNDLGPLTDVARLPSPPPADERATLSDIHAQYALLVPAMTEINADDQAGKTAEGQQVQAQRVEPSARELEDRADQLVGTTDRATLALIDQNRTSYLDSQHLFIGVSAVAIALALFLGFVISWSLIGPIQRMGDRLQAIASGDFSGRVEVTNRDELGTLAANVNRMNEQLGRLYKELESASKHKSEFLANMSHELRTPLNAVIGFSEVLQDRLFGELNDKQAEYITDIHSSGKHLLALINDILDLSKIEAGRMELQLSTFSLAELMQNSVALMRERATRQGIALTLEVDPGMGVIEADERKLKQVLFNLLTNAVKFTERGGHVDVGAHAAGDDVVIAVRDDGIGIAAEDQARIFEEFVQAGSAGRQEGTGLGLALSRRFIELHGGRLEVESELGTGSAFTFTVPRTQSPPDDIAAGDAPPAATADTPLPTAASRS